MQDLRFYLEQDFIDKIITIAIDAGVAILEYYQPHCEKSNLYQVQTKSDGSPVTLADKRAHSIIAEGFAKISPEIPLLSEEGELACWEERQLWQRYWLVDPLDGTREFIKENGEFTVNIALVENGAPVIGVVYAPALNQLYFASCSIGAYKSDAKRTFNQRLELSKQATNKCITAVISRSHKTDELEQYLSEYKQIYPQLKVIELGSSLKFCHIAEGKANIYPKLGATSEWDTAAGHAIVKYAGGYCYNFAVDEELQYNTKNSLLNPNFIVVDKLSLAENLNLKPELKA